MAGIVETLSRLAVMALFQSFARGSTLRGFCSIVIVSMGDDAEQGDSDTDHV
jgi:hypothetical protein